MVSPLSVIERRSFVSGVSALMCCQVSGLVGAAAQNFKPTNEQVQRLTNYRQALYQNYRKALYRRTHGAILKTGKVSLVVPEIVENTSLVALTVSVSGAAKDVKAVYLFTPFNQEPEAAQFYFTPSSGHVKVVTRIRVRQTQHCVAVAEMRNGDYYQARKLAKVTMCSGLG